jgi:nicotinamide phosphoribosyltransferase
MFVNPLIDTDGYKYSHPYLDRPDLTKKVYYLEARMGGIYSRCNFFGLQPILQNLARFINIDDVREAGALIRAYGLPFADDMFIKMISRHGGWPVRIYAVPEGTWVNEGEVLMRVESTDPEFTWVPGFLETQLMRVWYPTTVSTISGHCKHNIAYWMEKTCDTIDKLPFMLHDFGARGVSSQESAALGGLAHLVHFKGTDTCVALMAARQLYKHEGPAGFSIPASEHSVVLPWGPEGEEDCYTHALKAFAHPGRNLAQVSDTYDLEYTVNELWGRRLKDRVIASGATIGIRPDSGNPKIVVLKTLHDLERSYGSTRNKKGFKLLKNVRVVQGDGLEPEVINEILAAMYDAAFSADNLVFGMGGGLLQKCNRDDLRFAYKCCYVETKGGSMAVRKTVKGDRSKASKAGYPNLVDTEDGLRTVMTDGLPHPDCQLTQVFLNGTITRSWSLDQVRERADKGIPACAISS